jgi:hypothetical protein
MRCSREAGAGYRRTGRPTRAEPVALLARIPLRSWPISAPEVAALQRLAGNHAARRVIAARVLQRTHLSAANLNVVGEDHEESGARRKEEKKYSAAHAGSSDYWTEEEFKLGSFSLLKHFWTDTRERADPFELRWDQAQAFMYQNADIINNNPVDEGQVKRQVRWINDLDAHRSNLEAGLDGFGVAKGDVRRGKPMKAALKAVRVAHTALAKSWQDAALRQAYFDAVDAVRQLNVVKAAPEVSKDRGQAMHGAAKASSARKGVWKVGDKHREQMAGHLVDDPATYNLVSKGDFNLDLKAARDAAALKKQPKAAAVNKPAIVI